MDYDRVAGLPLSIEAVDTERRERATSSDFTRVTTVVSLSGTGETGDRATGRGEDVTYDEADHDALAESGLPDLTGEYTVDSFSERVGELDLFPQPPGREDFRAYRRWALESAALDLALRQAGTDLGTALDREYAPLRFVVSTRLGDPPTTDRVDRLLARGNLEFKLDPTSDWTADVIADLAATGAVEILDLKGQYEGTDVDAPPDPELYEAVLEAFPGAVIEDPAVTPMTERVLESHRDRLSWDVPIHGVEDVTSLPWEPRWLNVKPSRFGSLESLLETIAYCEDHGIRLYGGGQFELDVGRGQIQALASLFYPTGPNDVAPGGYNDPDLPDGLPMPPLEPPADPVGFRWS